MRPLRTGSSPLWLARASKSDVPNYSPLRRDLTVDVAIVGGGVTGSAIAWMLATQGARVAVIEAARVGRGSTAASTALLMQEPDEDFHTLIGRYGSQTTQRIWQRSRRANASLIRTLRTLRVRCDLEARDSVYYTLDAEKQLARELDLRHRAGLGGRWLGPVALERAAHITGGVAIRTTGNAEADPYEVCLGFLRAAEQAGAEIFERTRVGRVDTSSIGVVAHTPHGRIRADQLVVATGYATREFKPLVSHFSMQNTFVLATERLSPHARRRIGLSRVMLWDSGRPYHYARWAPQNRLLLGGADRPMVPERDRARARREGLAEVRAHFTRLYPSLASVRFEYAWEGLFASTPDGLPFVGPHRRYPRHLFALGYGGNGMTFGFLAAELLRDRLLDRAGDDSELFSFARLR